MISDLHVFARRSRAEAMLATLEPRLHTADWLVLNGDTFDFRWSGFPDHAATVTAADRWLRGLLHSLPQCEIRLVLGNHDCLLDFEPVLTELAAAETRFGWHRHWLKLGSALFCHGDCADKLMIHQELERRRERWRKDAQRGELAAVAYGWADALGLTVAIHRWHFPRGETIRRVAYYFDQTLPGWRNETTDCFFGHTHLPFTAHEHTGVRFHNTGSAVADLGFNPQTFAVPLDAKADGDVTKAGLHSG